MRRRCGERRRWTSRYRLRCGAEAALQVSTLHRSDAENINRNRPGPDAADDPFRTLATLTETLFKVRRLRQPGGSQATDDDLPSDPDAFRLALAQRIEAFVPSRIDAAVSERGQPADGAPAAS